MFVTSDSSTPWFISLLNIASELLPGITHVQESSATAQNMSSTTESATKESTQNRLSMAEMALEDKAVITTEMALEEHEVQCQPSEYMSGLPLALLMLSLCIGTFLVSLDRTIITVVSSYTLRGLLDTKEFDAIAYPTHYSRFQVNCRYWVVWSSILDYVLRIHATLR
jgi:hypothetical protein